ncbi:MAG: hypothetical protein HUJ98_07110, partial [Bacteroidaceae bacterium]|nr:hypothetical protein [Bacteroidaceae bacterium]
MSNTTESTNAQINVRNLPKVPITTEDFMGTLVGYDAEVNILVFPDKGGKSRNVTTNKVAVNRFTEWAKEEGLFRVHHKSCGVHWRPNLGGTKEAEIDTFTCQFVESDDLSLEEQYEALMEAPLKPTAIVRTKKSLHAYYKVNQATATLALWKAVQAQLIAYFHGDPSRMSANANCRLPGFFHCKGDPISVDVIYWVPENVYEQEDIHKAFPAVELPSKEEVDQERVLCKQRGLDNVLVNCDFFSYCKNHEHLPYLDWFNMINILTFLEDGLAIAHEYSKHDPRYKEEETEKVFLDAKKSSPGPTTCDKLMLGAFDCPKRKAGTCKCKSPLVWTLKPMEYNVLHEKISGLGEVPAEEGMNTAKEFVRKFLFNVERRTAKPLIKELATALKLTEADTIT